MKLVIILIALIVIISAVAYIYSYSKTIETFKNNDTKAICLINVSPKQEWLNFLKSFIHYDIYIISDDNKADYNSIYSKDYPNISFIQIPDKDCDDNGFVDINFFVNKRITGWEKALYYFSTINRDYNYVWFLEDDVFLYEENILVNIDNKYISEDFLSNHIDTNHTGKRDYWWWDRITIKSNPPYYSCMCCAVRMSKELIQKIKEYANRHKTLYFLEALFPTISKQNNLRNAEPKELSHILPPGKKFELEELDRVNLFHPIKDVSYQHHLRNILL